MSDALAPQREKLKKLILASLLLDAGVYQHVCGLLDKMDAHQLKKVEGMFWQAEKKRRDILHSLAVSNIDAFEQGVTAATDKINKNLQVKGVASLGREILKKSIKK